MKLDAGTTGRMSQQLSLEQPDGRIPVGPHGRATIIARAYQTRSFVAVKIGFSMTPSGRAMGACSAAESSLTRGGMRL